MKFVTWGSATEEMQNHESNFERCYVANSMGYKGGLLKTFRSVLMPLSPTFSADTSDPYNRPARERPWFVGKAAGRVGGVKKQGARISCGWADRRAFCMGCNPQLSDAIRIVHEVNVIQPNGETFSMSVLCCAM